MARRRSPAPPALAAGLRAATVTGVLALLLVLLGAAPASAHARFTGSDPAEGAQVDSLPATVVMSYSEQIAPQFVETAVVTPDGTTVTTTAAVDGSDVSVDLAGAGLRSDGGTWQVVARVVSVDGHPVEHTTSFLVPEPSSPAPPPAATSAGPSPEASAPAGAVGEPSGPASATEEPVAADGGATTEPATGPVAAVDGLPRWGVAAGAVVLVLAAAAALVVQLRRRPPTG